METLALTALVNHETADSGRGAQRARSSRPVESGRTAVRPYGFITYAVEIEGDAILCTGSFAALRRSAASPAQDDTAAPLYFFAEAVDD